MFYTVQSLFQNIQSGKYVLNITAVGYRPFVSSAITVNGDENHIHLNANMMRLFGHENIINFASTSVIHMPGADAKKIADNYASMFSVTAAGK